MSGTTTKVQTDPARACATGRISRTQRTRFVDMLALTGDVRQAAVAAGTGPGAMYRLRRRDIGFAARWHEAIDLAVERLEHELLARALHRPDGRSDPTRPGEGSEPAIDAAMALRIIEMHRKRVRPAAGREAGALDQHAIDEAIRRKLDAILGRAERE